MQIHGFNKTTLLDYPGHLASTIFLGGCNFRCPFCHNKALVLSPDTEPTIPADEVLQYLKKRQGILEGVCVSGGEPTMETDLPSFLYSIKSLGYRIKLDTNGYRPQVIKHLYHNGLIDFIAMDIKSSPEQYSKAAGIPSLNFEKIKESASFIMESGISYEFRTTIVKELHSSREISSIGEWLKGAKFYYLQNYQDSDSVILPGYTSHTKETLETFKDILSKSMGHVSIRGI